MKFILAGDIHIDRHIDKIDEKLNLIRECFNNNIENVIIPGDIFEFHKYGNSYAICELQNIFGSSNKNIFLIIGNHDIYHLNKIKPNTIETSFSHLKNCTIIDKPFECDNLLMVPWILKDNYDECITSINNTKKEYCVGHFEFNGLYSSQGIKYNKGFDIKKFSKFKKVISSHFHTRQEYKNIMYLGNISQDTWNDYGNIKGYHTLDTETDEINFFQLGCEKYHHIKLENSESDFDLDKYVKSHVKLFHHEKLSKKQFDKIEELKNVVDSYQIFDESVQLNEVKIENVEFKVMLDEFMKEQDFDDDLKVDITNYMNQKYEEIG